MRTVEAFSMWWEAFDTCRERNRPLVVTVGPEGGEWKIFPSGRCEALNDMARRIDACERGAPQEQP